MMTKAVNSMTPYEAVFGRKPDLQNMHEWGKKVWMQIEGGDKLGGHVREGHWMGVDKQSKGVQIYWPDKKTVSVEQNVHYRKMDASASRLEGEIDGIIETKANGSLKASNQLNKSISSPCIETLASSTLLTFLHLLQLQNLPPKSLLLKSAPASQVSVLPTFSKDVDAPPTAHQILL